MTEKITRCPECFTSFRVSDAHLNTERGAVRCGSCLAIFTARDHLIEIPSVHGDSPEEAFHEETSEIVEKNTDTRADNKENTVKVSTGFSEDEDEEELRFDDRGPAQAKNPEPKIQRTKEPKRFSSLLDDDDALISDDMDYIPDNEEENRGLDEKFDQKLFESGNNGDYEFSLFERDTQAAEDDDEPVDPDEAWALDLLETEDVIKKPEPTFSEEEEEERQITQEFEASYTGSFQIVGEKKYETEDVEEFRKEIEKIEFSDEAYESFEQDDESPSGQVYLESIEPEPLEFTWRRHSPFWHSRGLWGALSAFALAGLIGQIAWIRFDSLSVLHPYRDYYAVACGLIGCQLPDLIDRSKIRTTNLVVRSHPEARNALVVDAVLQNTASFNQTFPVLDLVFTDNQDKVVAARRLAPRDYLRGELAGRTHMPAGQPVHVAIEIADPGEQAVGYKLSIAD